MDQVGFLGIVSPVLGGLRKCMLQGYGEFDEQPPAIRVTVEDARPKWVNCRVLALLELEFGMTGPCRMVKDKQHQLRYLLVEGEDLSVGIRPKKVDEHWRSRNHSSGQQDEIRDSGYFPWYTRTFHLILGYQYTSELQPALTRIGLTWESTDHVELITPLWNPQDGAVSVKYVQEDLNFPQPRRPQYRRKARRKDLNKGQGNKQAS